MQSLKWVGEHLVGIAAVLAFLAQFITSQRNSRKLKKVEASSKAVHGEVEKVHIDINSRLQLLITAVGEAERAKGIEEGRRLNSIERDEAERKIQEALQQTPPSEE